MGRDSTLVTEVRPTIDRDIQQRFGVVADETSVRRVAAALEGNGITVLRAADAADAKRIVLGLIPAGSQVHHGASQTLQQTGITEAIVYEYAVPLEDLRAQAEYGIHSNVSKMLIIDREVAPGRITVVLVDEALGL